MPKTHSLILSLALFSATPFGLTEIQAQATPETTSDKAATPGSSPPRKTISRQELKQLLAEKLAAKADPKVIALLLDQARAGEKRSLDPLGNREAFEKLLTEMEELKKLTAQVRKETVGDLVDQSPTEPIEIVVNQTVNRLKARLGGDSRGVLEMPTELRRHPIPEYANTPLLLEKVNTLLQRQVALGKVLAVETAKRKTDAKHQTLAAMILAQEELIWEAGWPFTQEEVATIEKAGGKVPRTIYLSRLERGLETLNKKVTQERASVGRGQPARQFVLYRPAESKAAKPIDTHLLDLRGHADAWKELAKPFDEEAEKLFSLPEKSSE